MCISHIPYFQSPLKRHHKPYQRFCEYFIYTWSFYSITILNSANWLTNNSILTIISFKTLNSNESFTSVILDVYNTYLTRYNHIMTSELRQFSFNGNGRLPLGSYNAKLLHLIWHWLLQVRYAITNGQNGPWGWVKYFFIYLLSYIGNIYAGRQNLQIDTLQIWGHHFTNYNHRLWVFKLNMWQ